MLSILQIDESPFAGRVMHIAININRHMRNAWDEVCFFIFMSYVCDFYIVVSKYSIWYTESRRRIGAAEYTKYTTMRRPAII